MMSRVITALLAGLTVVFLLCAAVVFATGWRWTDPPVADVVPVPPAPPRQAQAYEVISEWLAAQDRSDAAAMRSLTCANPPQQLAAWIDSIER